MMIFLFHHGLWVPIHYARYRVWFIVHHIDFPLSQDIIPFQIYQRMIIHYLNHICERNTAYAISIQARFMQGIHYPQAVYVVVNHVSRSWVEGTSRGHTCCDRPVFSIGISEVFLYSDSLHGEEGVMVRGEQDEITGRKVGNDLTYTAMQEQKHQGEREIRSEKIMCAWSGYYTPFVDHGNSIVIFQLLDRHGKRRMLGNWY
jgi:hypothetical protein